MSVNPEERMQRRELAKMRRPDAALEDHLPLDDVFLDEELKRYFRKSWARGFDDGCEPRARLEQNPFGVQSNPSAFRMWIRGFTCARLLGCHEGTLP